MQFRERKELHRPLLCDLVSLDDPAFRALFRDSPIKRIGRDRFVRNVLIAIGNSGDATLTVEVERLLDDASPLVRAMAVWALSKLVDATRFAAIAPEHATREIENEVRAEWLFAAR